MRYTISQVAKASGVSARMLRHYDAIGLLTPQSVGDNGYRWYGRAELLRLQRIMVLRRLGLGLERIGRILREEAGESDALRTHLRDLEEERHRLDVIIDTVRATIGDLDSAHISDPDRFFTGLRRDRATMRRALGRAFGPGSQAALDDAGTVQDDLTAADFEHAAAQSAALFRRLAEVMRAGTGPEDPAALDAVAGHYESVRRYWDPTPESYAALGRLYVTDPDQRRLAEQADPELPGWLARAIAAYAAQRLGAGPATSAG